MFAYCGNNPVNYSDPFGYLRYDVATCSAADADWGVRQAAFLDPIYYKTEGMINGQGVFEFANEAFGLGTYAHNGCGIIAIYNVMQLLGTPESLGMICDEIINEGGLMLGGILGMNPFVIDDFFVSRGITCKGYSSFYALSKDVKEGTVILLMTLNNAYSLLGGAHFMAVQYVNGKYVVYNLFNNKTWEYKVDSLDNPYGLNGFLYGFIIGG